MKNNELIKSAENAMKNAYCPYSNFSVGAALLCDDETVFTGCNVENASYSMTMCAERTAFAKALLEGKRKFKAIAIVGGKDGKIEDFCYPCGACRQVISEFCKKDFEIILKNNNNEIEELTLGELLPKSFCLEK